MIYMAMMVRDLPDDERPREKLLKQGAVFLSDAELLAILLRTGTTNHSVLRLAEEVLSVYKDRGLLSIMNMSAQELADIKGIGMAKAATIMAAVELGKRFYMKAAERKEAVNSPEDVAAIAMPRLRYSMKENFVVLLLDTKHHVIGMPVISVGSLSASVVHPREVFETAVKNFAASMILVHNHPSGDPTPSAEDINITRRLVQAGKIMDIPVLDHVVIGDDCFISLKEKGLIPD